MAYTTRIEHSKEYHEGQLWAMRYLLDIARKTTGAEVWRAIFAHIAVESVRSIVAIDAAEKLRGAGE
jgi:hypothetical protein